MRGAGEFKAKVIRGLRRLLQLAIAIAGAYAGIMTFWSIGPFVPLEARRWLGENGVPLMGGMLPYFALVFMVFASTGALLSVWLLRHALARLFKLFDRRLVEP